MSSDIQYLTLSQIERLYRLIVDSTGGEYGYLSKSNLEYVLETVKDIGERLPRKRAIIRKAAFLLYNTIAAHPFLNGNKRTGYELMKVFLEMNGYGFEPNAEDVYSLLLQIAKGKASAKDAEAWIARNLTEQKNG